MACVVRLKEANNHQMADPDHQPYMFPEISTFHVIYSRNDMRRSISNVELLLTVLSDISFDMKDLFLFSVCITVFLWEVK